jgi:hypothetical protein
MAILNEQRAVSNITTQNSCHEHSAVLCVILHQVVEAAVVAAAVQAAGGAAAAGGAHAGCGARAAAARQLRPGGLRPLDPAQRDGRGAGAAASSDMPDTSCCRHVMPRARMLFGLVFCLQSRFVGKAVISPTELHHGHAGSPNGFVSGRVQLGALLSAAAFSATQPACFAHPAAADAWLPCVMALSADCPLLLALQDDHSCRLYEANLYRTLYTTPPTNLVSGPNPETLITDVSSLSTSANGQQAPPGYCVTRM